MKKLLSSVFLLFVMAGLEAQTVENITVEQDGDKLNIHYRIGGSTSEQLYFVTLTCSIDGQPKFEPKSVFGDVGANIAGGKSFNTIVWDVFKDVEEIGSIEFFVKVDLSNPLEKPLVKQNTVSAAEPKEDFPLYRKRFVALDGTTAHPLGLRAGTLGNWGYYGSMRFGNYDYLINDFGYIIDEGYLIAISGGVTKRFTTGEKFRLHGYTGLGAGIFLSEFEFELGLIGVISNRINVDFGFTYNYYFYDVSFGVGLVF